VTSSPAETAELAGDGCDPDALPAAGLPAWMIGHWVQEDGPSSETWVAAGAGLLGVGFATTSEETSWFEVQIMAELNDVLTFTAIPGGQYAVDFAQTENGASGENGENGASGEHGEDEIWFANPAHDFPQRIRYQRIGDTLLAEIYGSTQGREQRAWERAERQPAVALEDADRRFATDSAARGADAWADAFAADGVLWRRGRPPTVGPDEIRDSMQRAFADAGSVLAWEPHTSVLSPAGDMGLTIGCYRMLRAQSGASPARAEIGTYVTIWRRASDGAWKAVFDTGMAHDGAGR
jgi:ketosteroid isomerase-like protein